MFDHPKATGSQKSHLVVEFLLQLVDFIGHCLLVRRGQFAGFGERGAAAVSVDKRHNDALHALEATIFRCPRGFLNLRNHPYL